MRCSNLRRAWDQLSYETARAFSPCCTIEISYVHRQILMGKPTARRTIHQHMNGREVLAKSQDDQSILSLCWFKSVLHPNSRPRLFWLVLTLVALFYDVATIPLGAFNISEAFPILDLLDMILLIFWTIDIGMTFRTAFYVSSKVEQRPYFIAIHYLKTWFCLDFSVVLMGWVSKLAAISSRNAAFFKVARFFRILRILRLLRIAKLKQILESIEDRINSNALHLGFHMAKLVAAFGVIVHFTACLWYAVGESTDTGWPSYEPSEVEKTVLFWYSASLRWTLAQVNGRTDVDERRNMRERMFTCFVAGGLAILLMAVFISSITATMMELGSIAEERKKKFRRINEFLKKNQISASLTALIKHHSVDVKTVEETQEDDSKILSYLPKAIQSDLLYEIRAPLLLRHPLFGSINHESKRVMWQLCNDAMCPVIAEKDSTIFDLNDSCSRMLIVVTGIVLYTTPEEEEPAMDLEEDLEEILSGRNLSTGHRISEAALWMEWHNCGRLSTLGMTSHLVALNAVAFGEAVMQHLGVHARSVTYARAFVEDSRVQPELSDIMDVRVTFSSD